MDNGRHDLVCGAKLSGSKRAVVASDHLFGGRLCGGQRKAAADAEEHPRF